MQGTTGNPKGACLSHHGLLNNGRAVGVRIGYGEKVRHLDCTKNLIGDCYSFWVQPHRVCVPVPLYQCFGNVVGTISLLYHGGTCIFPSYSFDALAAMETVQNEK